MVECSLQHPCSLQRRQGTARYDSTASEACDAHARRMAGRFPIVEMWLRLSREGNKRSPRFSSHHASRHLPARAPKLPASTSAGAFRSVAWEARILTEPAHPSSQQGALAQRARRVAPCVRDSSRFGSSSGQAPDKDEHGQVRADRIPRYRRARQVTGSTARACTCAQCSETHCLGRKPRPVSAVQADRAGAPRGPRKLGATSSSGVRGAPLSER